MLEAIRTEISSVDFHRPSLVTYEVGQFMRNFFEAVQDGNPEEISTFFADEIEPFQLPPNADWRNEVMTVDEHLATFSCSMRTHDGLALRMRCVLDKSEGYWQIIHGQIHDENLNH